MGPYLRQLPQYYGDPPVRDLGLLASEGRMTIPLEDGTPSGVLDIWSHYFEFIPEGEIDSPQPTVLGAHELAEGKSYYIVPTTAYGLYRYHISDLVRVTGFFGRTPLVEFLGKGHRFANLTGEKLSEYHVTQAMDAVAARVLAADHGVQPRPVLGRHAAVLRAVRGRTGRGRRGRACGASWRSSTDNSARRTSSTPRSATAAGSARSARELIPAGTWATWDRDRLAQTGGSPEQYKHPCLIGDIKFRETMRVLREVN